MAIIRQDYGTIGGGITGITLVEISNPTVKPASPWSKELDPTKSYLIVDNGSIVATGDRLNVWQIIKGGEPELVWKYSTETTQSISKSGNTVTVTSTSSLATGYQVLLFEIE